MSIKNASEFGFVGLRAPRRSKPDLNENSIRDIGLTHGLVDVKVIAVNETLSGLKFVSWLRDR